MGCKLSGTVAVAPLIVSQETKIDKTGERLNQVDTATQTSDQKTKERTHRETFLESQMATISPNSSVLDSPSKFLITPRTTPNEKLTFAEENQAENDDQSLNKTYFPSSTFNESNSYEAELQFDSSHGNDADESSSNLEKSSKHRRKFRKRIFSAAPRKIRSEKEKIDDSLTESDESYPILNSICSSSPENSPNISSRTSNSK